MHLLPWELDLRSLGAFRIALGVTMLVQIAWRLVTAEWWYAPDGFAGPALRNALLDFPDLSLFAGATSALPVQAALVACLPLALLLLFGVYARLAAWGLAFIFVSLEIHNPIFLGNEIWVANLALIWAGLLPIDKAFSIRRHASPAQMVG